MKRFYILTLLLCTGFITRVAAQPKTELVEVRVTPLAQGWKTTVGQEVLFDVAILRDNQELKGVGFTYKCYPEQFRDVKAQRAQYVGGNFRVRTPGLRQPGFITCAAEVEIGGKRYSGQANVAVSPEAIEPYDSMPADFREFWSSELTKVKATELAPQLTLLPERCTPAANVYHVSFANGTSRIYGILSVPVEPGKYPAILNVPGAGVRPYEGDTYLVDSGFISLTIGIHGIPVNLVPELYDALFKAGLSRYWTADLESRDRYYYKRVYTGAVRAVDFIFTLGQFDGKRLAVCGGSQGGALAIVVAALDERVQCYTSFYPALCDMTAYRHGRAGGWPALFKGADEKDPLLPAQTRTALYFSTTNFARLLTVPGFLSWGYNDTVCPPGSVQATYNVITAPKEAYICPATGHWNFPEQWERKQAFIKAQFGMQ